MQPYDSFLYEFGFLSVIRDLSPLSVDFESLVINVSRDLFNRSNIDPYILVSFETVLKSGTDLTSGTVGKRAPDGASASDVIGSVQPALDGAALGLSLWLGQKLVLNLGGASACLPWTGAIFLVAAA